jgi:hypothetical protein
MWGTISPASILVWFKAVSLPVASALALTGFPFGSSDHFSDVNASNEILW